MKICVVVNHKQVTEGIFLDRIKKFLSKIWHIVRKKFSDTNESVRSSRSQVFFKIGVL